MSLQVAGKIITMGAVDGLAGLLCSVAVESVAPPIKDQQPWRLLLEGVFQLAVVTLVAIEVGSLIASYQDDPTNGLPFAWGVLAGMPNTMAKLGTSGRWIRGSLTSAFVATPAPAPSS